jgi:putative DNA primase/helicase
MKQDKIIDWSNSNQKPKPTKKPKAERAQSTTPETNKKGFIAGYFRPLGWSADDGSMMYYFYISTTMSIVKYKASALNKNNLLSIAPLEFWLTTFPNRDNSNFDAMAAADYLISFCNSLGFYDTHNIRGRGAWQEKQGVIFHTGNSLITGGQKYALDALKTEYTYEYRKAIEMPIEEPLSYGEAAMLPKLLSKLNWQTKADYILLSGWLALSTISGILKWRPHVWITGPRGNGKSWVLENVVNEVIGSIAVSVQGTAATEPAVRQKLNSDALPVTIDEGEGNDERAAQRMQEIIGLARAASSEKSPAIAKGGKDGKAIDYFVRSCFLFVSINPQLVNDSDKRRFCILELKKLPNQETFSDVERLRTKTIFENYGTRFQARMVSLADEIQKSIKIFTHAVSLLTEDRAVGDQFGALLGGWWHTWNDKAVTPEAALEEASVILEHRNVQDEKEELTDEQRCLQQILSQEVRIESENYVGTKTIGELVEYAHNYQPSVKPSQAEANERLMRLGIRVINDDLLILNTSVFVKKVLTNTPWQVSWATILLRLKGASKRSNTRFAAGMSGRCVSINLKNL